MSDPDPEPGDPLKETVIAALRCVYDPEIPVNIYDLGLIYGIDFETNDKGTNVRIALTLTSVNCPLADMIPGMVYDKLAEIPDLNEIDVKLVFDPPWDPSKMTQDARIALDMGED